MRRGKEADDYFVEKEQCPVCSQVDPLLGQFGIGGGRMSGYYQPLLSPRSYPNIPICGRCGGLGEVPSEPNDDFEKRVQDIQSLLAKWYPNDPLPDPPPVVRWLVLRELVEKVGELVAMYGEGGENSLAHQIVAGKYRVMQARLHLQVLADEASWSMRWLMSRGVARACLRAMLTIYSGKLEEGKKQLQRLTLRYPDDPLPIFYLASYIVDFERNPEQALSLCERCIFLLEKRPQSSLSKAGMYFFAGRCAYLAARLNDGVPSWLYREAAAYFQTASEQPDYRAFVKRTGLEVEPVLKEIEKRIGYLSST